MLDIHLSAICSRNEFTTDPAPVIDELRRIAGPHQRVLAATVGHWVGYYDSPARGVLTEALLTEFSDAVPWVELGAAKRARPAHSTGEFHHDEKRPSSTA